MYHIFKKVLFPVSVAKYIYASTNKWILKLATNTETIQSLLSIRKPLMLLLIEFIRQHIVVEFIESRGL